MNVDIEKLADESVEMPSTLAIDSMLDPFSMPPITQAFFGIWGDFARHKMGKDKGKKSSQESSLLVESPLTASKRLEKAGKESRRPTRAKEALEQRQREVFYSCASTSHILRTTISGALTDPFITIKGRDPESKPPYGKAPVDAGATITLTTDA
ncbi:hypothetical protein KY290_007907 [Solanum tuberosum]|uniref:Uncharacterized protein n=1 Tax=Solanum tuberosum TaxID=4113 RepID=A0ABQ7W6X0_SOLTU|nr:hypothetical protein KY290_007907 [Solanum tuberosum]